jgi:hypothetical protein
MPNAAKLTRQGIAAVNAGERDKAVDLLRRATEADPRYEMAWLWRSSVATTDEEKRGYLEQALKANPYSTPAKRGLDQLGFVIEPADEPPEPPLGPHLFSSDGVSWVCSECEGRLRGRVVRCPHCKVRFDGKSDAPGHGVIQGLIIVALVVIILVDIVAPLLGWL